MQEPFVFLRVPQWMVNVNIYDNNEQYSLFFYLHGSIEDAIYISQFLNFDMPIEELLQCVHGLHTHILLLTY